jgi:hypothetical protein
VNCNCVIPNVSAARHSNLSAKFLCGKRRPDRREAQGRGAGQQSKNSGRATVYALSRWLPIVSARVHALSGHVEFVVDKMALRQVFSEQFGFPC